MTTTPKGRLLAALAVPAIGAVLVAGCSSGSNASAGASGPAGSSTGKAIGKSAPLFDQLPAKYQKSKRIVVGSDIAYAPMEYYDTDGTTVLGFDKDLTDLLSKQLGVTFQWRNATFDGLMTQLQTKRIDVAISGMSDTPERQQKIDFVDYYQAGAMMLVKKGNPEGFQSIADLCGQTVAVQRGTTQEGYAKEQSTKCTASGKKKINLLSFDRETEALLQVKSGRAEAGLEDYPVATYNARTSGGGNDFEVAGDQIQAGPLGIGVAKDNKGLSSALRKAVQNVIDDGSYAKLIKEYEVPLGAIKQATVNGG